MNKIAKQLSLYVRKYHKIVFICFFSWISVTAIFFLLSLNDSEKNIIWLILFFAFIPLFMKATNVSEKRDRKIAVVIAVLFSILFTVGKELLQELSISKYFTAFGFIEMSICLVGFAALFYVFIILFFHYIEKIDFCHAEPTKPWFADNRHSFFVMWAVIFLCWLPYLIIFFPGIFTNDSFRQFLQGLGLADFSAHHTIIHTAIMSLFIRLGDALGSHNLGAALYSVTQMIIMSAIFSFVLRYLAYRNIRPSIRLLLFAYFALYPVNALYSITGWKDVMFGGLCLMSYVVITEICRQPEKILFRKLNFILICVVIILFVLFRNNAIYALILFLPFFIVKMRNYWKVIMPMILTCGIIIFAFNWCSHHLFNVQKTDPVHALSVPLQQIARTVTHHGDNLTQEEMDELSRYFYVEKLPQLYDPVISDPIKRHGFKSVSFTDDKASFIKIWFRIGLKYPEAYLNSFLCNSFGYWYPGVDYWIYGLKVQEHNQTRLHVKSLHLFPKVEQFLFYVFGGIVHKIPVVSLLSSLGFMTWVIILSIGIIMKKNIKNMITPILLPGFLWLTTLASPVYSEYRYIYGVILCVPVIFILSNVSTADD